MMTSTGFGQRATCSAALTTNPPLPTYDIVNINTSPAHLNAIFSWNMQPGDSYTISGWSKDPSGCTFQTQLTNTVTYTIQEYCELLYPRVRLSWLNELAGRDYFNFTMLAEPTNDASYEAYGQNQVDWSAYLPVPTSASLKSMMPIPLPAYQGKFAHPITDPPRSLPSIPLPVTT